jgi:hypothetical protein
MLQYRIMNYLSLFQQDDVGSIHYGHASYKNVTLIGKK